MLCLQMHKPWLHRPEFVPSFVIFVIAFMVCSTCQGSKDHLILFV